MLKDAVDYLLSQVPPNLRAAVLARIRLMEEMEAKALSPNEVRALRGKKPYGQGEVGFSQEQE